MRSFLTMTSEVEIFCEHATPEEDYYWFTIKHDTIDDEPLKNVGLESWQISLVGRSSLSNKWIRAMTSENQVVSSGDGSGVGEVGGWVSELSRLLAEDGGGGWGSFPAHWPYLTFNDKWLLICSFCLLLHFIIQELKNIFFSANVRVLFILLLLAVPLSVIGPLSPLTRVTTKLVVLFTWGCDGGGRLVMDQGESIIYEMDLCGTLLSQPGLVTWGTCSESLNLPSLGGWGKGSDGGSFTLLNKTVSFTPLNISVLAKERTITLQDVYK